MQVTAEKAAIIFERQATLKRPDKQQYKNVAGFLSDYYNSKKNGATGDELNRYTSLEKKYNDLYTQIR